MLSFGLFDQIDEVVNRSLKSTRKIKYIWLIVNLIWFTITTSCNDAETVLENWE